MKTIILTFIALLALVLSIIGIAYSEYNSEMGKGDCFDRYSNKIIGEVCEKRIYESEVLRSLSGGIFIICCFFLLIISTYPFEEF